MMVSSVIMIEVMFTMFWKEMGSFEDRMKTQGKNIYHVFDSAVPD